MNNYLPWIDGLRALAILLVVAYHAFPELVPGGYIGVDIFFVISGYLISGVILKGLNEGRFSLADFYARRIRRIFPSLFAMLSGCFLFGWFAFNGYELQNYGRHMAGGAAFISNFLHWKEVGGYFSALPNQLPLLNLWSLGVEEQFYLFFPLFMMAAWRFRPWLPVCLVSLFLCSFFANLYISLNNLSSAFYWPQTRVWELLAGCIIQIFFSKKAEAGGLYRFIFTIISLAGLALILYAAFTFSNQTPFPRWAALLPVLGAAGVLLSGFSSPLTTFLFANRPMVFVGLISYPLYLWHWPVIVFMRTYAGPLFDNEILTNSAAVAAGLILTLLTYYFFEKPLRFSPRRKPVTVLLICLMAGVTVIGYLTYRNQGFFYERYPDMARIWSGTQLSGFMPAKGPYGSVLNVGDRAQILFTGDSHAAYTSLKLAERLHAEGQILTLALRSENGLDINKASSDPDLQTVIFCGFWFVNHISFVSDSQITVRHHPEFYPNEYSGVDRTALLQARLRKVLTALQAADKKVVFMIDVPRLASLPVDYLPSPMRTPKKQPWITREQHDRQTREYMDIFEPVLTAFPNVYIFDPTSIFCDEEKCSPLINGVMQYYDDNHLSATGAETLSAPLVEFLKQRLSWPINLLAQWPKEAEHDSDSVAEHLKPVLLPNISLDGQVRQALMLHSLPGELGNRLIFRGIEIPDDAVFNFGMALHPTVWDKSDGVLFGISVIDGGREVNIYKKFLDPKTVAPQWLDENVDLRAYGSKSIDLVLFTQAGEQGSSDYDNALWSGLKITSGIDSQPSP